MNDTTILVIDDSSTIRRLVDNALSRAGYSVALAPDADTGLYLAEALKPELILLDHQLPGTTGYSVCQQLLAAPDLCQIPVVVSSTLRKRAYVEYAELSNVVDMLPKPYTEELLTTCVTNAIDTGSLVVQSQTNGTAVPEVIDVLGEAELSGDLSSFTIREIVDFVNNARKTGTLEVESDSNRFRIYLDRGKVQGVTATGISQAKIVKHLPDALRELAPILKVTTGGNEFEAIVDLLNTDLLDPRLLRQLLRYQAAVLLLNCFTQNLRLFRFLASDVRPTLYERLPLDVSVLALLVEGAVVCATDDLPPIAEDIIFSRRPIRGQNLDRAGLPARHARILGQLTSPRRLGELSMALEWDRAEVRCVMYGLELAGLVSTEHCQSTRNVLVFEGDAATAERLNRVLQSQSHYRFVVLSEPLAFQLSIKRAKPDVVVADPQELVRSGLHECITQCAEATDMCLLELAPHGNVPQFDEAKVNGESSLSYPYTARQLIEALDKMFVEPNSIDQRSCEQAINHEEPLSCPQ